MCSKLVLDTVTNAESDLEVDPHAQAEKRPKTVANETLINFFIAGLPGAQCEVI
jgi:hypothetical protein